MGSLMLTTMDNSHLLSSRTYLSEEPKELMVNLFSPPLPQTPSRMTCLLTPFCQLIRPIPLLDKDMINTTSSQRDQDFMPPNLKEDNMSTKVPPELFSLPKKRKKCSVPAQALLRESMRLLKEFSTNLMRITTDTLSPLKSSI